MEKSDGFKILKKMLEETVDTYIAKYHDDFDNDLQCILHTNALDFCLNIIDKLYRNIVNDNENIFANTFIEISKNEFIKNIENIRKNYELLEKYKK